MRRERCNLIKLQSKPANESTQIAMQITKVTSFVAKANNYLGNYLDLCAQTPLLNNKSLCFPCCRRQTHCTLEYTQATRAEWCSRRRCNSSSHPCNFRDAVLLLLTFGPNRKRNEIRLARLASRQKKNTIHPVLHAPIASTSQSVYLGSVEIIIHPSTLVSFQPGCKVESHVVHATVKRETSLFSLSFWPASFFSSRGWTMPMHAFSRALSTLGCCSLENRYPAAAQEGQIFLSFQSALPVKLKPPCRHLAISNC